MQTLKNQADFNRTSAGGTSRLCCTPYVTQNVQIEITDKTRRKCFRLHAYCNTSRRIPHHTPRSTVVQCSNHFRCDCYTFRTGRKVNIVYDKHVPGYNSITSIRFDLNGILTVCNVHLMHIVRCPSPVELQSKRVLFVACFNNNSN